MLAGGERGAGGGAALWLGLWAALLAWLVVLFLRTPVPSEDGVSYLWMAERFAAMDWPGGLSTVFPPGWPLLLAPWVALGVPVEVAAFGVAAVCLLVALRPMAAIVEHFAADRVDSDGAPVGWTAALLLATSPLLARLGAEGFSEPAFLAVMAWGTLLGLRGNSVALGLCAAAAFWIRPEGALLVPALALAGPNLRAIAARAAVAGGITLLGVVLLGVVRSKAGHGFDPLPIHAFHETRHELVGRGDLLGNLLAVPGPWLEAFGVSGLLGLFACGRGLWPLRAAALLQVGVVLTFVVRRRFFVSAAVAVHALAALALQRLPRRLRHALLALAVGHALVAGWTGGIDADRAIERELGIYLRSQPAVAGGVVSEAVRVVYFAGLPPPEPRRDDWQALLERAEASRAAYLVLSRRAVAAATAAEADAARLAARYTPAELPSELASGCAARGLVVFARRAAGDAQRPGK